MVKTSQVRVAAGDEDRVYPSLDDVPADLRRQIRRVLSGPLSDTIVIADEGGRRRIFEAVRGLPPHLQKRVMAAIQISEPSKGRLSRRARLAIGGAILLAIAIVAARMWL